MPRQKRARRASHAGSWYTDEADGLAQQISQWLDAVPQATSRTSKAIIAPHAGYRYSGHVMAHAYRHIAAENVSRVFLLGPSHHVYVQACLLSKASSYSTPFGDIPIDLDIYNYLMRTGAFEYMPSQVDEAEHSLELHLPYIAYVMRGQQYTLVPIMVGALDWESEARFGELLAPYFDDSRNFFVISSDFCHWGSRFSYTFYDRSKGEICDSIRWLDLRGVEAISSGNPEAFQVYMRDTSNTICGRHPIAVLLQMMRHSRSPLQIEMMHYDQSSKCLSRTDSSVSYVAAVVTEKSP